MNRSILVSVFLLFVSSFTLAQRVTPRTKMIKLSRPHEVLSGTNDQASNPLADVIAVTPVIPRGPLDVLQDYRNQMTLVSETLSQELGAISQAVRSGQISRTDAEYLIQQRTQLALIQYEVFSALHDILAYELAQNAAAAAHRRTPPSESGTVLVAPPWCTSTDTSCNSDVAKGSGWH